MNKKKKKPVCSSCGKKEKEDKLIGYGFLRIWDGVNYISINQKMKIKLFCEKCFSKIEAFKYIKHGVK